MLAVVDSDGDDNVAVGVHPGIVTAGAEALDMSGGETVVSAEIHIDTAGFLADDAGVGGNHSVVGGFTGVETSHTHSGRPQEHTKLDWGGIGNFLSSFFF